MIILIADAAAVNHCFDLIVDGERENILAGIM